MSEIMREQKIKIPNWLKKIKCFRIEKSRLGGTSYQFNWGEFVTRGGFALTFEPWSYFDERPMFHIKLPCLFNLFFHLPIKTGKDECETPMYGVYWIDQALCLCFHRWRKHIYMPWSWNFYKRWEQVEGYGKDRHWVEIPRGCPYDKIAFKETHDYKYVLKSGEIQNRKAEISVNRMEWRMKSFMWFPFINKSQICINVSFDGEVGEGTGSWKGGTTGCGYEMKSGETPLQTLRRMETERKF